MTLSLKVNVADLISVSNSVSIIPGELSKRVVTSVNRVADSALATSKKMIVAQVNLTSDYVDSKIGVQHATESSPVATITAKGRGVLLIRFGAKQLMSPASSRGKGRPSSGIPQGMKQAGISVNVKASGPAGVIQHGFFMKLRNGNGMGVFARTQSGKLKIRSGPSVDQVFQGVAKDIYPQVEIDLQRELLLELDEVRITK
jgi:hypothetical protein